MGQGVVDQADSAMKEKDYLKAVDLYQQHLFVFENDQEVQLKYADALLKLQRTPKHLETALAIYNAILNQKPDREDVRRRAAEVAIEIGGRRFEMARYVRDDPIEIREKGWASRVHDGAVLRE